MRPVRDGAREAAPEGCGPRPAQALQTKRHGVIKTQRGCGFRHEGHGRRGQMQCPCPGRRRELEPRESPASVDETPGNRVTDPQGEEGSRGRESQPSRTLPVTLAGASAPAPQVTGGSFPPSPGPAALGLALASELPGACPHRLQEFRFCESGRGHPRQLAFPTGPRGAAAQGPRLGSAAPGAHFAEGPALGARGAPPPVAGQSRAARASIGRRWAAPRPTGSPPRAEPLGRGRRDPRGLAQVAAPPRPHWPQVPPPPPRDRPSRRLAARRASGRPCSDPPSSPRPGPDAGTPCAHLARPRRPCPRPAQPAPQVPRSWPDPRPGIPAPRARPSAFHRGPHLAPRPAAGSPRHGPSARGAALTAAGERAMPSRTGPKMDGSGCRVRLKAHSSG